MKSITKRISIIAIALALLIAIGWAALRPPAIECIALERSTLQNTFSEIGEVIPVAETDLYTKFGGKLLEVNALEGSPVTQGEVLFVFDSGDLIDEQEGIQAEITVLDTQIQSQVDSLESDRKNLQIQIEQARMEEQKQQANLDSTTQLYDIGAVSAQDLSNAQMAYELAVKNREMLNNQMRLVSAQLAKLNTDYSQGQQLLAQKAAREAQLNVQLEKISEMEVIAPQAGMIRDSALKEGQLVPPGTKLCSIYQPDIYRIDCYILVENTVGVNAGDEVEITLRLQDGDKKYPGRIIRKSADAVDRVSKVGLSEKRVKVEVTVEDEDWAGMGPYWPVEVRFVTARADDCLLVPKTALLKEGDDVWKVWAVRNGKVNALTVERGIQTPSQAEIKSGLEEGDIIIKNAKTSDTAPGKSVRAVINEN